jgi:hypothetical protein
VHGGIYNVYQERVVMRLIREKSFRFLVATLGAYIYIYVSIARRLLLWVSSDFAHLPFPSFGF